MTENQSARNEAKEGVCSACWEHETVTRSQPTTGDVNKEHGMDGREGQRETARDGTQGPMKKRAVPTAGKKRAVPTAGKKRAVPTAGENPKQAIKANKLVSNSQHGGG